MNKQAVMGSWRLPVCWSVLAVTPAQDRLKTMPGYEQFQTMNGQIADSVKPGTLNVTWKDAATFEYTRDGKLYRYDVASRKATELGEAPGGQRGQRGQGGPERGRQFDHRHLPTANSRRFIAIATSGSATRTAETSPPSRPTAAKRPRQVRLPPAGCTARSSTRAPRSGGRRTARSWRSTASTRARCRTIICSSIRPRSRARVDIEAYPKAGAPNPIVDVFVYDVATSKSVKLDVRDGKPFENAVVGHYVYRVGWTPDGSGADSSTAPTAGRTSWSSRRATPTRASAA